MLVIVVCLLVGSEIVMVIIGVMVFVVTVTAFDWLITAVVRSLVGEVVVVFTVTVVSGAADLIRGDDDIVEVGTVEIIQNQAVKAFFSPRSLIFVCFSTPNFLIVKIPLLLWESVLGVLWESVLALGHSTWSLVFGRSCHTTVEVRQGSYWSVYIHTHKHTHNNSVLYHS